MNEDPAVSVIVPVYNGGRTIGALLSALRGMHDVAGGHEIIVVDNGSSDGTREVVGAAALRNLRLVDETRRGPSAARNRGLEEARGELVALLDADCVPSRPWLRTLIAPFEDPAVVIVAGGLASYPPRTAAQRFAARYGLNDASRNVAMARLPFANSRNMAVRRTAALAVGGFPEDLMGGEDVEFSFLVRERFGCPIVYEPAALAFHQDREDDEALRKQAENYGRSMAVLYARHPDLLQWRSAERARRLRTSVRRRLSVGARGIAKRFGWGDAESLEFATYLNNWTRWFWSGFDEARRSAHEGIG